MILFWVNIDSCIGQNKICSVKRIHINMNSLMLSTQRSDIVAITPMDSLWLHPAFQQTTDPESQQHVSQLVREAVYTSRPIAITYKNNLGETHDREVLYLTNWITNNKTGQDFTYLEALPFLCHPKFMDTNWSYFTGYCTFRHTSRIFLSQNIQSIAIYNCHKLLQLWLKRALVVSHKR